MNNKICTTLALLSAVIIADAAPLARTDTSSQVTIPAGVFESVLPPAAEVQEVHLRSFRVDRTPVTNEQFLEFVERHPQWRRGVAPRVFADQRYLSQWPRDADIAPEQRHQPVVQVSWFAASAYCESRGARLPTWHEWEYIAAASESARDGRNDAAWRQATLTLQTQVSRRPLPPVGTTPANYYGVRDLHGVVSEWVEDVGALLVSADNREQGDPNALRFCGAGALTMEQKENYSTVMRIAFLSGMQANSTHAALGFRCVTDIGAAP